ncbi:hypothetical protein NQ315_016853 [Exocentrus adspersus]|uniref:mitogen-activated protein kinase kinase n=1 Tax=Exocentrus adspersus TaxID=1586481 RepID=A0AAV8VYK2_9CUCU|nr:hypothetical protein NQ315_016853 [Exocentrus adspersus]
MSNTQKKINDMLDRLSQEKSPPSPSMRASGSGGLPPSRPNLSLGPMKGGGSPSMPRPKMLSFATRQNDNLETERKLKEIMKISGDLKIGGLLYKTDIKDMEDLEELGNGTCGHVVKMKHKPSGKIIAVKQMRRSGNADENKRIIMDIEVVLKSHDCKYIVQCFGCFITEAEVWICMELMDTCFDKLLKRFKQPVPEEVLGKVTVATVEALSYLKDKHGVIHRDVKPSNILLDSRGNVKLCDFGISGRLVDSMAKSRSAGCAAYMAPERIEPDPQNPDYDVRADVWSLGITLVELATGIFPYSDCNTDFEVLSKVIEEDPPALPQDKDFSPEFRSFVSRCLTKDKQQRPKYTQLKNHDFIKKYETVNNMNVGEWYVALTQRVEDVASNAPSRHTMASNPIRQFFTSHQWQQQASPSQTLTNGSQRVMPQKPAPPKVQAETRVPHVSRLATFQSAHHQRETHQPAAHQRIDPPFHQSTSPNTRSYSPFQAYQNHVASLKEQSTMEHKPLQCYSPLPPRRFADSPASSPYQHRRVVSESRWRSPNASPLPLRSQFQADEQPFGCGNTSPLILQRFYHQQKQQQMVKEAEESGKKRFASYIKLQLSGDRSGRSSRHQSPEPPPRLNRRSSGENQSPLALRRNFLETHTPNSPSLSRRYVSPTPPVPPPRRLSESTSVPGSPQHLRARFHYTPEPQRRLFRDNDLS